MVTGRDGKETELRLKLDMVWVREMGGQSYYCLQHGMVCS